MIQTLGVHTEFKPRTENSISKPKLFSLGLTNTQHLHQTMNIQNSQRAVLAIILGSILLVFSSSSVAALTQIGGVPPTSKQQSRVVAEKTIRTVCPVTP